VADVFRQHSQQYLSTYGSSPLQRRVLRAVTCCRTAALGGHVQRCDHCGHEQIAYNSCRNRHCPKCQGSRRIHWLEARAGELLPVPYYHVVFTLPTTLSPLALQNPQVMYHLLFKATAATLLEVAANPRHLGARIGFLALLHTWGQNLMHHPHVHCVVPAGGLAPDGTRWVSGRKDFFLPVRVLSRVFRGKFIQLLKEAWCDGRLQFHGDLRALGQPGAMEGLVDQSVKSDWVVYAKPPFGGPQQTLKYLARYTHRVAISNGRLLSLADGRVSFRWKDYAHGNRPSVMTLEAVEFIRRFLLHVVPSGLVRIRYYGFMANRHRTANLEHCRQLLEPAPPPVAEQAPEPTPELAVAPESGPIIPCPVCSQGRMVRVRELRSQRAFPARIFPRPRSPAGYDTS